MIVKRKLKNNVKYLLVSCKTSVHMLTFVLSGNPFVKKAGFTFSYEEKAEGNDLVSLRNFKKEKDLLKIPSAVHAFILDDHAFFLGNQIETLFGFDNALKEKAKDKIIELKESALFNNEEIAVIEKYALSGRNYYKFENYERKKVEIIKNPSKNQKSILEELGIVYQNESPVIDQNSVATFTKIICNIILRDIFEDEFREARTPTATYSK